MDHTLQVSAPKATIILGKDTRSLFRRTVKIINKSRNPAPAYATPGSAGMDVCASLDDGVSIAIAPFERKLIPTGLFVEIPEGFEMQVRPRSGLALGAGITVLNSPGTIDSDYRGEIRVLLINLSPHDTHIIANGDRIAQLVVAPYVHVTWDIARDLSETERGDGGFGHSGMK